MLTLFKSFSQYAIQYAYHYTQPPQVSVATQTDSRDLEDQQKYSAHSILKKLSQYIRLYTYKEAAYLEISVEDIKKDELDSLIPHCKELGRYVAYLWSPDGKKFYSMEDQWCSSSSSSNNSHFFTHKTHFRSSEDSDDSLCTLWVTDKRATLLQNLIEFNRVEPNEAETFLEKLVKTKEIEIIPLKFKSKPVFLYQFVDANDSYIYIERHADLSGYHYSAKLKCGKKEWQNLIIEKRGKNSDGSYIFCFTAESDYLKIVCPASFTEDQTAPLVDAFLVDRNEKIISLKNLNVIKFDLSSIGISLDETMNVRSTPLEIDFNKNLNNNSILTRTLTNQ